MSWGGYAWGAGMWGGTQAAPIIPSATDLPKISVQVAFTTNPGDVPVWTTITEDREVLQHFTINRGRSTELDRFQAGRATIVLANEDRRFDPTYTSSPYYPNVVPMRRIRVLANYGGVSYSIFSGYVDTWEQQYMPPQGAVCVVQATDAFKVLANAEMLSSAYAETVQGTTSTIPNFWWRFGEPSGSTQAVEAVTGNYSLVPVNSPVFGAGGLVSGDPNGAVQFTDPVALTSSDDGLQGVFPEGTWPFTNAMSVEFIYRYDGSTGFAGLAPVFAAAALTASDGSGPRGIQTSTGTNNVFSPSVFNAAGTLFEATAAFDFVAGVAVHIVVTWAVGSTIRIYINGADVTYQTATVTGTFASTTSKWIVAINAVDYPPFPSGTGVKATYDEFAIYNRVLTPAEVAAHAEAALGSPWTGDKSGARTSRILDFVPWPSTDRYIDTGVSVLGEAPAGGSALSMLQKIEETEQGALFISADGYVRFIGRDSIIATNNNGVFGDSGAELEYADLVYVYDDQLIFNDIQVTREGGITQVFGDATSQSRYLRRSKVFDGLLYSTDSEARGLAQWTLSHYKDPLLRATNVKLEPSAGNALTHYPHVLGRELMDRLTVRRRPQNLGAAIDQEVLIEGITHDVTGGGEWRTTWNLSPAETQTYWLLETAGRSELGVTTRLGF